MSVAATFPKPSPDDRAAISRRRVLIGGGLCTAAALAAAVTPRRFERQLGGLKLDGLIPDHFGSWSLRPGGDVVVPEQSQPSDFYDQVLTRTFFKPGSPDVALLIAYGGAQSGLMKVHRPEVCYASAGFKIADAHDTQVAVGSGASVPARAFVGVRDARMEQVLYWTRVADAFPQSMNAERWVSLKAGLRGVIPDGVLVRFSTITADVAAGQRVLIDAAQEMVRGSDPRARRFLIGRLASA